MSGFRAAHFVLQQPHLTGRNDIGKQHVQDGAAAAMRCSDPSSGQRLTLLYRSDAKLNKPQKLLERLMLEQQLAKLAHSKRLGSNNRRTLRE